MEADGEGTSMAMLPERENLYPYVEQSSPKKAMCLVSTWVISNESLALAQSVHWDCHLFFFVEVEFIAAHYVKSRWSPDQLIGIFSHIKRITRAICFSADSRRP